MNLGQMLKIKRKEKGLTQGQVAKTIGVSTNTVSKYERNIIANMGREKVIGLSRLLDIPTVAFIEAIDELESNNNIEKITSEDFEQEIYTLLSKHAQIKYNYSTWLFLTNKLLNNVVNLDDKQKQQIISYLELYDNGE